MKKKGLALVLALTLLVVGVVAGTLAWLTAKSDTVVNTFTTSDIEVKLEETKGTTVTGGKEFKMIPGYELEKDPKAWVVEGSEDCIRKSVHLLLGDISTDRDLIACQNRISVGCTVVTAHLC